MPTTITLGDVEHTLRRPYTRVALMVSGAVSEAIPDDAEYDDEDNILPEYIPPEFGIIAAASAGLCLPKSLGAPQPSGALTYERILEYGDKVDTWGFSRFDSVEWTEACNEAMTLVLRSLPDLAAQEKAAVPTGAHTEASSPA